jgi:xylulokinase
MEQRWYLAFDLGTGGSKVAAIRADGHLLGGAFRPIDTVFSDDGGAEQDTDQWWDGIISAVVELMASIDVDQPCAGIGITGQWGSTVPLDAAGSAVGPCMLYTDNRGAQWSKALTGGRIAISGYTPTNIARWLRLAGGAPNPDGNDPTGHAQFLEHARPEIYARTAALVEPVDYIGMRLTGCLAATPASMVASWLTDNRRGAPTEFNRTLIHLARRDRSRLPELRPTGALLGPLSAAAASELGGSPFLPAGTPVVCGVPDLHTAAMGAGAVADFAGHIAISTTAWVSAPVPFKKTDINRQMASVPGLRRGSYLIANNHETGGAALRWLRYSVFTTDAESSGYDAITEEAASAPAGSGGVIFCPWLNGERSPVSDSNLRACFLNVSLSTTRAHFIRAVLEGVAYNALWMLEATEKLAGRQLDGLRLLGGGAISQLWCQIHADVIGRPIMQVDDPLNVNVRGAAWFAAMHLGHVGLDEIAAMAPTAQVFEPNAENAAIHVPLYAEFVQLAKAQRGMYKRLNGRRDQKSSAQS